MTKAQIKFLQSLGRQKYRKEHNAYLVEGDKNAVEWLDSSQQILGIAATGPWLDAHISLIQRHPGAEIMRAEDFELEKVTSLQHAQEVVIAVKQPAAVPYTGQKEGWYLYLDKIQDPGNMGTIIRIADWFGLSQVICSPDCVEWYNPKVVQASMGSLLRIPLAEMSPEAFLATNTLPLYATALDGIDIRQTAPATGGVIAMGNESKGLSSLLLEAASHRVLIPGKGGAESLNVAVATGIVCATLTLS
ncbi:TrmH family RNA methyltransferase [Taibaiella koreensis]|uniref:TrmH family RNA methyltransferase n=1 Tax=Taibaiella koreensis TaxID=1268548 RepID=UPI000E5A0D73|nr:RNA methyltransferase [Taibaiella koreensis]